MVVFLSTFPCCWDTCEEDGAEVHVELTAGIVGACSPFLGCGICAGFVLQEDFTELSCFSDSFAWVDDQQEARFKFDYSIKIWQPPKEVR